MTPIINTLPVTLLSKTLMPKTFIPKAVLTLSCLMSAGAVLAEDIRPDQEELRQSRENRETAGVIGGMALGAVVAGPPGAIIFGIAGGLIADGKSSRTEKEAAEAGFNRLDDQYARLQQENSKLQLAYANLERSTLEQNNLNQVASASNCCFDTELVLHFKTNSSDVENHYLEDLRHFAALVKANPDAVIELTGYADQRGQSTTNLTLSRERLQAVENKLQQLGLDPGMLQGTAFGDTRPLNHDNNPEALFFDRRVVITARTPGNERLSHVPD